MDDSTSAKEGLQDRTQAALPRQIIFWVTLLLFLLLALCVFIGHRSWQSLLDEAQANAQQELSFLEAILGETLQAGNLRDVPELVARWGALSDATTRLQVSSSNGFTLGKYQRTAPAESPILLHATIRFSYRGQAQIELEKDLSPIVRTHRTLLWELTGGYLFIAAALIAFGRLALKRQHEAETLHALNQRLQHEIAHRKEVEAQLRGEEERFRELIENLPNVAVRGCNREHRVTYWNAASTRLYGYSREEAEGRRMEDLVIPSDMRDSVKAGIQSWLEQDMAIPPGERELQHEDGRSVPVYSSYVMLGRVSGNPEIFCIDVDLTEQKQAQAELRHMAAFDVVTDLPNRANLERELHRRLEEAKRFGRILGVLFIDLDNFKVVNDTLGHAQGDVLLKRVAGRLRAALREYDFLARFGGDEFILLVGQLTSAEQVSAIADKLIALFSEPYLLADQETYVTASLGVAIFPRDGRDSSELLQHADAAMYRAKESGRNRVHFYAEDLNPGLSRQHQDRL